MQIFAKVCYANVCKNIMVEVQASDTVEVVKDRIWVLEGIPVDRQRLMFGKLALDDGNKTIRECNIPSESTLQLFVRAEIDPLHPTERSRITVIGRSIGFSLDVCGNDTVYEVKKMIQEKDGSPPEHQVLSYFFVFLDDDLKLSHYNIQTKSELRFCLTWRKMTVKEKSKVENWLDEQRKPKTFHLVFEDRTASITTKVLIL